MFPSSRGGVKVSGVKGSKSRDKRREEEERGERQEKCLRWMAHIKTQGKRNPGRAGSKWQLGVSRLCSGMFSSIQHGPHFGFSFWHESYCCIKSGSISYGGN
jgi:hypothetical protein